MTLEGYCCSHGVEAAARATFRKSFVVRGGYPRMNLSLFDCVLFATFASVYVFANEQPVDGSSSSSYKVNTDQDATKMICILDVSVKFDRRTTVFSTFVS